MATAVETILRNGMPYHVITPQKVTGPYTFIFRGTYADDGLPCVFHVKHCGTEARAKALAVKLGLIPKA